MKPQYTLQLVCVWCRKREDEDDSIVNRAEVQNYERRRQQSELVDQVSHSEYTDGIIEGFDREQELYIDKVR